MVLLQKDLIMINCLIHYRKLKDRLEFFHEQTEGKIEYHIIDDEVEDGSLFDISEEAMSKKKEYLKPYFNFHGHMPPITKSAERSVAVKQVQAWLDCADQDEPYFILEDDVIFTPECFEIVERISKEQNDWDIIMFGESCGLRAGDGLRSVSPPMTRGLSAYLIHPNFARKIKEDISTISMAVDWELNYLTVKHNCKMFWYEPILFGQGSQGGPFTSAIQE
jgi:hypothetical protein